MKFLRSIFVLLASVVLLTSCGPEEEKPLPQATHLYFSDYSGKRIGVVDLNNLKTATTLVDESDGLDTVVGIAVDFLGGHIYAAEETNDRVIRVNIDGTGTIQPLYGFEGDSVSVPTAIALDLSNGLYWTNSGTGQIKRGTKDGSEDPYSLFDADSVLSYSYGLAYDPTFHNLFWSDFGSGASISAGEIDRGNYGKIFGPSYALRSPSQLVVFYDKQVLYWSDESLGSIGVGNTTSGSLSVLYDDEDGIERADGIAVDFGAKKIYWTDTVLKKIMRANLDGSGDIEVVLEDVDSYSIVLKFDNQ